jgi:1-acyl-sn-glycerol-3-phosphate acyltransferase
MMRLSRDIAVDREDRRSRARVFLQAGERFRNRVSVIIFPEGTRSPDGRVRAFSKGPFSLALREHIAILPIAVDGTFDALPKRSWKFRVASDIRIHVFEPVELAGWEHDADGLRRHVRTLIVEKIAAWRGVPVSEVDATRMAFIPVPTSV